MFPAGRYYVGDLCYAIEDWDKFCDMTCSDMTCSAHEALNGEYPWKSGKLWINRTAYGDGEYRCSATGLKFDVDAGLIGVMPAEMVDKDDWMGSGHIVEFTRAFVPVYEDGVFMIGRLSIDTDGSSDEDDESEDEEDEDDYED
jgi:hypothetical protein